jgi:hypothetical protein
MVKGADVAKLPSASTVWMVKGPKVPCDVGVPTIFTEPVLLAASDKPGGRTPLATLQTKGGTPPVAVTVAL